MNPACRRARPLTLGRAAQVLADTHALLLNGCVFDELPAELVLSAAQQARANGGAVFFDPGAAPDMRNEGCKPLAFSASLVMVVFSANQA